MSITREQIIDLGFKPDKKKSPFSKQYDTLIYSINKTDYLYFGYNHITKNIDFKRMWKSCVDDEGNRITYQVAHTGDISFSNLKEFITKLNGSKVN